MYPHISVLGKNLSAGTITFIIGIISAGFLGARLFKRRNTDYADGIIIALFALIGIYIGSVILYSLTNIKEIIALFKGEYGEFTFRKLYGFMGGMVFYGGLFGGIAVGSICVKKMKLDKTLYSDVFAVCIPFFHSFGRIGCFFNGCCYGIESRFGFVFTEAEPPGANGISRFPVQLLEALLLLILFSALFTIFIKGKESGRLLGIYLGSYAFLRFFIEFLRGDKYRGFIFGLSISQWISVLILAVLFLKYLKKRKSFHKASL